MKITEEYKVARPVLTVALAFILRLRFPIKDREECLTEARQWVKALEREE